MTVTAQKIGAAAIVLVAMLQVYWSVISGLVGAWSTDDNYSHGIFIVPLAIYFAWERRAKIAATPIRPSLFSLVVIAGSLSMLVAGLLGAEFLLSRVFIIGTIAGAI